MKVFTHDVSICNGCYNCQIACKDEHVANDWAPYARPQPDTGQFWVKMHETVRGTMPKVKVSYFPRYCMHCDDAPCMTSCKPAAIYKRDDGLVVIDPVKCTGCKLCEDACPYDAIYFNDNLNIAQKCTGCAHLLDDGWDVPRCVDACATGAVQFGEESELQELIAKARVFKPEYSTKPRVYYMNIPKKFVAGTVYDPVEKEVVIGAACTLEDKQNGETFQAETDAFGDFWFHGLPDDRTFSLLIEKDGKSKSMDGISTAKDVNLGDIPMRLC